MLTESDLTAALRRLEADPPVAADVLGLRLVKATAARRRRHTWAAAITVAAVILIAVVVPTALSHWLGDHGAPAGPGISSDVPDGVGVRTSATRVSDRFSFTVGPVPGYTFSLSRSRSTMQTATVLANTSASDIGGVYVFPAGQFDPAKAKSGKQVDINSHIGYFGPMADPEGADTSTAIDAITWEYGADSWAMVRIDFGGTANVIESAALEEELKVARAVQVQAGPPVKLPFKLSYIPAGVFPISVDTATVPAGAAIGFADGRGATSGPAFGAPITLWWDDASDPDLVFCPADDSAYKRFTLDGHTGCVQETSSGQVDLLQVDVSQGHVEITIDPDHAGIYSTSQLLKIVHGLTPATAAEMLAGGIPMATAIPR